MSIEEYFADDLTVSQDDLFALRQTGFTEWLELAPVTLEQVRIALPDRILLADKVYRVAQSILWGETIASDFFPEAKCFHRIVMCKRPAGDYLDQLIEAEKVLLDMIGTKAIATKAFRFLQRLIPDAQRDMEKFATFWKTLVTPDTDVVFDHMLQILSNVTQDVTDYICVALDKRAMPLYWMAISQRGGAFYFNSFVRSLVGTLLPHYDPSVNYNYPGCGAPFFSYVTDKMMQRSKFPYFFITALEGTQRTMATIEGAQDGKPQNLILLQEKRDIVIDTYVYVDMIRYFSATHVYFPTNDFRNAWKRVNDSTKRARTVRMCIACNMNVAKLYREDLPSHVFCSESCYNY